MQRIELKAFNVAGVQFRPSTDIEVLTNDDEISLVAEPENKYDVFAIMVLARFDIETDEGQPPIVEWRHIGYIPKTQTWILHVLRIAQVQLYPKLFVNHDAPDPEKLIVKISYDGEPDASFIH
jgi:hypothetical protein